MDEDKKYIELANERLIISLPMFAVSATVECDVYDGSKALLQVYAEFDREAIQEAIRKGQDGYLDEDDDLSWVNRANYESIAMIEVPENTVGARIKIKHIGIDGGTKEDTITLGMHDIREAQKRAEHYIDEEDKFVLTEKGMAYLNELRAENTGTSSRA